MGEAGVSIKSFDIQESEAEERLTEGMETEEEDFEENVKEILSGASDLGKISISRLRKLLKDAIAEEDYVKAAKIRDTIKKKEEDNSANEKSK